MCADETHVADAGAVVKLDHEPVLVAGDIEDRAVIAYDTGVAILCFDVDWRPPGRVSCLSILCLERLLRISMRGLLPELPQCPFGDDVHRVFLLYYIPFWETVNIV
jgi:hypothetical protein